MNGEQKLPSLGSEKFSRSRRRLSAAVSRPKGTAGNSGGLQSWPRAECESRKGDRRRRELNGGAKEATMRSGIWQRQIKRPVLLDSDCNRRGRAVRSLLFTARD